MECNPRTVWWLAPSASCMTMYIDSMSSQGSDPAIGPATLVSVAITAYNSEEWLARALDSVLQQRTDFPIEIVIADDCSQDSTLRIAGSYREQHPGLIRVLERSRNLGIQRNYYETFEQCRGRYIAWLDADDYWTDPEKLAIQVHTLESDPSISACCHFVRWRSKDGKVNREKYPAIPPGRYGMEEILRHNIVPSPSVVFRNGLQRDLPAWYFDLAPTTDWPLWVLAACSGDIVLIDRVMADYMLTPGSSLASKGDLVWYRTDARFYEHIESILPAKWHRLVRAEKGRRYESMAYLLRKQGEFTASRVAAVKAFRSPSVLDRIGSKTKALLAATLREVQWKMRG
jgi:glycosyltransferase involved in cell wall biosynthesis